MKSTPSQVPFRIEDCAVLPSAFNELRLHCPNPNDPSLPPLILKAVPEKTVFRVYLEKSGLKSSRLQMAAPNNMPYPSGHLHIDSRISAQQSSMGSIRIHLGAEPLTAKNMASLFAQSWNRAFDPVLHDRVDTALRWLTLLAPVLAERRERGLNSCLIVLKILKRRKIRAWLTYNFLSTGPGQRQSTPIGIEENVPSLREALEYCRYIDNHGNLASRDNTEFYFSVPQNQAKTAHERLQSLTESAEARKRLRQMAEAEALEKPEMADWFEVLQRRLLAE